MTRRIGIGSYFSLPTDLAAELGAWSEFVAGAGYSADLKSPDTGEIVTVRFVEVEGEAPGSRRALPGSWLALRSGSWQSRVCAIRAQRPPDDRPS